MAAKEKIHKLKNALPKGTVVLCKSWLQGRIDGETIDGKYIIVLDTPVDFPTLGISVQVVSFAKDQVEVVK